MKNVGETGVEGDPQCRKLPKRVEIYIKKIWKTERKLIYYICIRERSTGNGKGNSNSDRAQKYF